MKLPSITERRKITLRSTMNTSDKSTNDKADSVAEGFVELARLLNDLEDSEFYTLPEGEWEAKNNRDENGFPLK